MIVVTGQDGPLPSACPDCQGPLRRWGFARARRVRLADDSLRRLQPRRARCRTCKTTHVLLPAWCLPRRAAGVEVIGAALLARAHGASAQQIASDLDLPHGTVQGWLRRAEANSEFLRRHALQHLVALDPHFASFAPRGNRLAEALDTLAAATHTSARVLALPRMPSPWKLAAVLTGGLLLSVNVPEY